MEEKGPAASLRFAATGIHTTPAKPHQVLLEDELNHFLPPQVQELCWNSMARAAGSHVLISSLPASLYLCIPVGMWSFWLHMSAPKQRLWATVPPAHGHINAVIITAATASREK